MFNVKFCSVCEDGSESTIGISCPHYGIYKRKNGTFDVVTYKSMLDADGVSRSVGRCAEQVTSDKSYQSCYIENAQGKTVEAIRSTSAGNL